MKISGGRNLEISSPGVKASGPPASRMGREERKAGWGPECWKERIKRV